MSTAPVQTYHVSIRDTQLFLSPDSLLRDPHEHECALGKQGLGLVHFAEKCGMVKVASLGRAFVHFREHKEVVGLRLVQLVGSKNN